jgi:hypothetical protein
MAPGRIGESGEAPELLEAVYDSVTHPYAMLAISAPSSTESLFLT